MKIVRAKNNFLSKNIHCDVMPKCRCVIGAQSREKDEKVSRQCNCRLRRAAAIFHFGDVYFRVSLRELIYPECVFYIREKRFYSLTFTFRRRGIFAPFSDKRRCLFPRLSPRVPAFASSSVPAGSVITLRDKSVLLFSSSSLSALSEEDASRLR